jgi:polysaccharide export outer membrane protein
MRPIFFLIVFLLLAAGTALAISESSDYVVGKGDVLKIMVYDNPDLETVTRVGGDGLILFPLIGEVEVDGLTVGRVAETIARKLAQGYLLDPQVNVFVEEFRSQKAIIMGQIKLPGLYEMSGPTTLAELISKAGGVTADAGDTATVKRQPETPGAEEALLSVNLKELLEKRNPNVNFNVRDGDSVFIPKAGVFYVTGQVKKPDAYKYEEGTSVIKAITMAGGFTELASERRIKIIRKSGEQEKVLEKVPLHAPVMPDDVIVVPESFF